jgi:hypothetical protein
MTSNEFIFGSRENVDRLARARLWQPNGRASWLRRDGGCVYFLAFEEQLAGISKGERVYVVGKVITAALRRLIKIGAIVVKAK